MNSSPNEWTLTEELKQKYPLPDGLYWRDESNIVAVKRWESNRFNNEYVVWAVRPSKSNPISGQIRTYTVTNQPKDTGLRPNNLEEVMSVMSQRMWLGVEEYD